jgi:group I intron endonuclease
MKTKIIYKITNFVNQKVYIGQTVNPRERKYSHMTKSSCIPLRNSVAKYGKNNFSFEVIASVIPVSNEVEYCKIADEIEEQFIQQYQSHISLGKGYNVSKGGSTSPKTEEWKKKFVATRRANGSFIQSEETKEKLRQANLGKKQSEETLAKRFSDECKQKMSEAASKQVRSDESNKKRSESLKGLKRPPRTAEHAAKLGAARKSAYQKKKELS